MLGGAETLLHTREIIENAIRSDPSCGVWATVDVDFQNAFPSLVYEAIDSAVGGPKSQSSDHGRGGVNITAESSFCYLAKSINHGAARSREILSLPCKAGVSLQISQSQLSQT